MYKIPLSQYAKIFYAEWRLNPESSKYNLSIDQILYGNLNIAKFTQALFRYVSEHVLLNSHIEDLEDKQYWVKNNEIRSLEYFDHNIEKDELFAYISRPFDVLGAELYRFKLICIKKGVYRFIAVMHHLLMDGSTALDAGIFAAVSNYYNDEHYRAPHNLDEQIKLITSLSVELNSKIEKNKDKYKNFWRQSLVNIENSN